MLKGLGFSAPPLTRAVVIGYTLLSLTVAFLRYGAFSAAIEGSAGNNAELDITEIFVPYLVLVPGLSGLFPWVLLTTSFVEQSVFSFLLTGAVLFFCGRYVERIWGSKELGIFLLAQAVIPTLITVFNIFFIVGIFHYEGLMMQRINGGYAFQTGFLVALKQLVPEHSIVLFSGTFKVQFKFLVIPALATYVIFGIFHALPVAILATSGFLTAWIYLRFVKVVYIETLPTSLTEGSSQQAIRGDASDTFALAKFFYPATLSDFVAALSDPIYNLFVKSGILKPFNVDEIEAGNLQASIRSQGLHNNQQQRLAQADSDRRRTLALKALEERLAI